MIKGTASVIRRPDKGLTISGSRVTLYALMDYLHANWPHDEIREWLNLTDEQLRIALDYIEAHHDEIEAEYRDVLHKADERRRTAEERLVNTWRKRLPRLHRLRKLRCMRSWPSNEEKRYESCSTKRLLSHREYHPRDYAAG